MLRTRCTSASPHEIKHCCTKIKQFFSLNFSCVPICVPLNMGIGLCWCIPKNLEELQAVRGQSKRNVVGQLAWKTTIASCITRKNLRKSTTTIVPILSECRRHYARETNKDRESELNLNKILIAITLFEH